MRLGHPRTVATGLFALIAVVYTCLALTYPLGYIWATYEDLFGEWIQFWCFVTAASLSARVALRRSRYRLFFAVLGLSCFYVAMEEISWGQRIFGFGSPEFFKANNLQGETNLHNFLTGPYSTMLKGVLTYAVSAAVVIYGLAYPLALDAKLRLALWLDRLGLAAPPTYLAPYFVAAGILELGLFRFNEAEIAELLVAFALAFTALHFAFALGQDFVIRDVGQWLARDASRLAVRIGLAIIIVLNVSALTTLTIYATPSGRGRIERRIENGVEKFAGRYGRNGNWELATRLYKRIHAQKPKSVSTLRKLAEGYRQLDNPAKSDEVLAKALKIDLDRYESDPTATSVLRSLVRTYRVLGNVEKADKHLADALRIGLERIENHPDGANAAYSLGRTYELMERNPDALKQFERAKELKPTSKKFRKAYYRIKSHP